jgi:7-carboxy-7-deazaguanine synthase
MYKSTVYKVNEVFESIQGEGAFTGVPSIFIRLQGCPVGCPWCDTKHTWHENAEDQVDISALLGKKGQESAKWSVFSSTDFLALFEQLSWTARHVVITGGEPAMYDLTGLTQTLIEHGFTVQVETSGTFELKVASKTWITLSPKINMPGGFAVLPSVLQRADEIKHPVGRQRDIDQLEQLIDAAIPAISCPIYLQPISLNKRATQLVVDTVIKKNWRLSLQTHKFIDIE